MPHAVSLPTRLEAMLGSRSNPEGVRVSPVHCGVELATDLVGVWVLPQADGRLAFQVIGMPATTGFEDTCSLLQSDARADFAPASVRLDGDQLVCMEASSHAPMLREGFTLDLESTMARALSEWLPRLIRVAELAAPIAKAVEAHLAPAPSAHGVHVCAELVATILLDRKSVDGAFASVASHHWTLAKPEWQAALTTPAVRQLLDAVAEEGGAQTAEATA